MCNGSCNHSSKYEPKALTLDELREHNRKLAESYAFQAKINPVENAVSPETKVTDEINSPKHYMLIPEQNIEVINVIEAAIDVNGIPAKLAPKYANVLKYMLRCGRKGSYLKDLKKAQFYLNRMIEQQEMKDEY